MDDKEALNILIDLLRNDSLTPDQKQALDYVIGILSWTSLKSGAIKSMKEKRENKRRNALR